MAHIVRSRSFPYEKSYEWHVWYQHNTSGLSQNRYSSI